MTYRFCLCSPDKRFPNERAWYLKINEASQEQIVEVFDRLKPSLELKFGYNHHFFNQHTGEPSSDMAIIFHPTILGGYWISNAIDLYEKYQVLYVGEKGQMFPPKPETFIVHSEKVYPSLQFPTISPTESIIITKWKDGRHYYLESSIGRIFSEPRYYTYREAFEEASQYVDANRISTDESKTGTFYKREGD
jgi:hypothetical protein